MISKAFSPFFLSSLYISKPAFVNCEKTYIFHENIHRVVMRQGFFVLLSRCRSVRETTPSSLIKDSETIGTPGSTTRPTNSTATNRRMQNSMRRSIPTTHEMEEFFAGAEQLQQRIFTEKYTFFHSAFSLDIIVN